MKWKSIKKNLIICIAIICVVGGVIIHKKVNKVEVLQQKSKIIDCCDKNNKKELYIEYINVLKSKMKSVSKLIVLESNIKVEEKFGYSEKNTITLSRTYKYGFGFDTKNIIMDYDENIGEIDIALKQSDIELLYCDPISKLKVVDTYESIGNKFLDLFSNDDTELMCDATNYLNQTTEEQIRQSISKSELRKNTKKCIVENIRSILGEDVKINISIIN